LNHGVGTAGPTAQALVIKFNQRYVRFQDVSNRAVTALDVPEVARVLNNHRVSAAGVTGPNGLL